jgi:hypothetical protein
MNLNLEAYPSQIVDKDTPGRDTNHVIFSYKTKSPKQIFLYGRVTQYVARSLQLAIRLGIPKSFASKFDTQSRLDVNVSFNKYVIRLLTHYSVSKGMQTNVFQHSISKNQVGWQFYTTILVSNNIQIISPLYFNWKMSPPREIVHSFSALHCLI